MAKKKKSTLQRKYFPIVWTLLVWSGMDAASDSNCVPLHLQNWLSLASMCGRYLMAIKAFFLKVTIFQKNSSMTVFFLCISIPAIVVFFSTPFVLQMQWKHTGVQNELQSLPSLVTAAA